MTICHGNSRDLWAVNQLFIYLFIRISFANIRIISGINSGRSLPCIPHALAVPLEPCSLLSRLTLPSRASRTRVSTLIRKLASLYMDYRHHPAQNRSELPPTPPSTSSDLPRSSETMKAPAPATNVLARTKAETRHLKRSQRQSRREALGVFQPHSISPNDPIFTHRSEHVRTAVVSR